MWARTPVQWKIPQAGKACLETVMPGKDMFRATGSTLTPPKQG